MAARDFIDERLLPWLKEELASEAKGSRHYIAGMDDAIKALMEFIESHRDEWDVPD